MYLNQLNDNHKEYSLLRNIHPRWGACQFAEDKPLAEIDMLALRALTSFIQDNAEQNGIDISKMPLVINILTKREVGYNKADDYIFYLFSSNIEKSSLDETLYVIETYKDDDGKWCFDVNPFECLYQGCWNYCEDGIK